MPIIYLSTLNSSSNPIIAATFDGERDPIPHTNAPVVYGQVKQVDLGNMLTFYTNYSTVVDDTGNGGLEGGNFVGIKMKTVSGVNVGGEHMPFNYPGTWSATPRSTWGASGSVGGDTKSTIVIDGTVRAVAETAAQAITGHRSGLDLFSNKTAFGNDIFSKAQSLITKVNEGGGMGSSNEMDQVSTQAINGYLASTPERFGLKYKSFLMDKATGGTASSGNSDIYKEQSLYRNLVARVDPPAEINGDPTFRRSTAVLVSVLMSGTEGAGEGNVEMIQVMKKEDTLGTDAEDSVVELIFPANSTATTPSFTGAADRGVLVTQTGGATGTLYISLDANSDGNTSVIVKMTSATPFNITNNVTIGTAVSGEKPSSVAPACKNYGFVEGDRVVITDELFDTNFHVVLRRITQKNATKLNGSGSNSYKKGCVLDVPVEGRGHIAAAAGKITESYDIRNWEKGVFTGVVLSSDSYIGVAGSGHNNAKRSVDHSAKAILTVRVGGTAGEVDNLTAHPQNNPVDRTRNVWDHKYNTWHNDVHARGFGKTNYYTFAKYSVPLVSTALDALLLSAGTDNGDAATGTDLAVTGTAVTDQAVATAQITVANGTAASAGTGLAFKYTATAAAITSITVTAAGTGYQVGNILTIEPGATGIVGRAASQNLVLTLTADSFDAGGTGYEDSEIPFEVSKKYSVKLAAMFGSSVVTTPDALNGSADDLEVDITAGADIPVVAGSISTTGAGTGLALKYSAEATKITNITVTAAGTGYSVGDTVTIDKDGMPGRDSDLVFTLVAGDLDNVLAWGSVETTVGALNGSADYLEVDITAGADIPVVAGSISTTGAGTGLALKYSAEATKITNITVTAAGTGYSVGDTVTIDKDGMPGRDSDLVFTLVADDITLIDSVADSQCHLVWANSATTGDYLNSIQKFILNNRLTPTTAGEVDTGAKDGRNAATALGTISISDKNKLSAEIPIETGDVFVVLGTIKLNAAQNKMDGKDIVDDEGDSTMEMHFAVVETPAT